MMHLGMRSQELLNEFSNAFTHNPGAKELLAAPLDRKKLISWLGLKNNNESELLLESLRDELLKDLRTSLPGYVETDIINTTSPNNFAFFMLILAGALVAACEGFDGVTTILGVISLPSVAVLIAGLSFSVLSVIVFCGLDLVQLSKHLGIRLSDAPKLMDTYLSQLKSIKSIRKHIEKYKLLKLSVPELQELQAIIAMLEVRYDGLTHASKPFESALHSVVMSAVTFFFLGMAGLLFFGGGFFAGQTVAAFMLELFFPNVAVFWPIVIFSTIVGFAALFAQWYFETEDIEKLITAWFGLDDAKIEQLCGAEVVKKERNKLALLKETIQEVAQIKANKSINDGAQTDEEVVYFEACYSKIDKPKPNINGFFSARAYLQSALTGAQSLGLTRYSPR